MTKRTIRFGVRKALQSTTRKKSCDCSKGLKNSKGNYGGEYIPPAKGKRK